MLLMARRVHVTERTWEKLTGASDARTLQISYKSLKEAAPNVAYAINVSSGINGHRLTADTVLVFQVTWAHTSGRCPRVQKCEVTISASTPTFYGKRPSVNEEATVRRWITKKTFFMANGCLIWTGTRTTSGYGKIKIQTYRVWTGINKSVISATRNVSIRPPVARGKRGEHVEKELLFRETLHWTHLQDAVPDAPRVIVVYDNSCQLHRYGMNRDPHFLKMTVSLNEQANPGLIRIQPQLVYMSPSNFMFHASLFLTLKNMRVCEDREVNVGCGADTTACISVKTQTYHASYS
ncbi:hypothetical protein Bbelb_050140 [Branchiostoma belcheri]|nr:hypothetical protein Bbelb_050140 [Branchiostoma belcheri]